MQKIVVDTNILVSALIQKSYPYLIIQLFADRGFEWYISDGILEEYFDVLTRPKFAKYPQFASNAELLLAHIQTNAQKINPKVKLRVIADNSDNKFLELAAACKANYLVAGNTQDFTMKKYRGTKIVSPKEFWELNK